MSAKRGNQTHEKNMSNAAYQRAIVSIVKQGSESGFAPAWADKKPGEDPCLPLKPPGRRS